jgi:hypothetical protein
LSLKPLMPIALPRPWPPKVRLLIDGRGPALPCSGGMPIYPLLPVPMLCAGHLVAPPRRVLGRWADIPAQHTVPPQRRCDVPAGWRHVGGENPRCGRESADDDRADGVEVPAVADGAVSSGGWVAGAGSPGICGHQVPPFRTNRSVS